MPYRPILPDEDTIAAIATPMGRAGIGIIRISGSLAEDIAKRIFVPKKSVRKYKSHHLYLGHLQDPDSGDIIDEVLLSVMRGPHSYTREDVVEINSHSGPLLLSKILKIILKQGARLARPGEFSLRAFLNNRIDLTQAEAVMDLINAQSERGIVLSSRQVCGAFRQKIQDLRGTVVDALAQVEAAIDYPEEAPEILPEKGMAESFEGEVVKPLQDLTGAHGAKRVWVDGVETVIAGRVNVGKSSLLNRLSQEQKAIVTPIPGTTRDVIDSFITIQGIPFHMLDTAGFRDSTDDVERLGVGLAEQKIDSADFLLIIMDQSRPLVQADQDIINKAKGKKALVVLNKIDLPTAFDHADLIHDFPVVRVSALTGEGFPELEKQMAQQVLLGEADLTSTGIVPNLRQQQVLSEALDFFTNVLSALRADAPMEIVATDLKSGLDALGEVTGEGSSQEDILERIFSRFCLGK